MLLGVNGVVEQSSRRLSLAPLLVGLFLLAGLLTAEGGILVPVAVGIALFGLITASNLLRGIWLSLVILPLTRDGVIFRFEYIDIHLAQILQAVLVIVWLAKRMLKMRSGGVQISRSLWVPLTLFWIWAFLETFLFRRGSLVVGMRELSQYSLNILTCFAVSDQLSSLTSEETRSQVIQWLKVMSLWALLAIGINYLSSHVLPHILINMDAMTPLFSVVGSDRSVFYAGVRRLELGLGAPYAAFPALIMVGSLLVIALSISENRFREWRVGLLVLFLFVLLMTYTRSAWLGFFGGAVALLLLNRINPQVAVVGVTLLTLVLILPSSITVRFMQIFSGEETSRVGHLALWKVAWGVIRRSPIFGMGFGSLDNVVGAMPLSIRGGGVLHSAFYQLWGELGTVGILLFASAFFSFGIRVLEVLRGGLDAMDSALLKGLFASTLGLCIQALFVPQWDYLLWFLLGVLSALERQISNRVSPSC